MNNNNPYRYSEEKLKIYTSNYPLKMQQYKENYSYKKSLVNTSLYKQPSANFNSNIFNNNSSFNKWNSNFNNNNKKPSFNLVRSSSNNRSGNSRSRSGSQKNRKINTNKNYNNNSDDIQITRNTRPNVNYFISQKKIDQMKSIFKRDSTVFDLLNSISNRIIVGDTINNINNLNNNNSNNNNNNAFNNNNNGCSNKLNKQLNTDSDNTKDYILRFNRIHQNHLLLIKTSNTTFIPNTTNTTNIPNTTNTISPNIPIENGTYQKTTYTPTELCINQEENIQLLQEYSKINYKQKLEDLEYLRNYKDKQDKEEAEKLLLNDNNENTTTPEVSALPNSQDLFNEREVFEELEKKIMKKYNLVILDNSNRNKEEDFEDVSFLYVIFYVFYFTSFR